MTDIVDVNSSSSSLVEQQQADLDDDVNDADFEPSLDVSLLPKVVKSRIKALKKNQFETVKAEERYTKELIALDVKFQKQYDEINAKRLKIISGKHEPAGEEIEWSDDKDKEEEEELSSRVQEMSIHKDYKEDTKGIPKFWYRVLKNASDAGVLHVKINKDHDEAVLESLLDISVELAPAGDWFRLNFHFAENKWFSNSVLTKEYELSIKHDPDCPLEYDGREISGIKGCKIDWKDKEIQAVDSFFNFFNPLDVDKDTSIPLIKFPLDYDDGLTIKEKILPRAVLFFTGEMKVEYDVSSDDDEDEE